ncbi:LAQU0S01e04346g1_1 [Lachancea quebecensis]|uniref:LAQU0S01e04346g1_1 n=1 Tax=Lachancea quebecensis TaxID=1654605 RepID=A0A0P1KLR9_9SACH|nr:LAQU0S01e04346g1_1 [Lachancea quebecensis]
MHYSRSQEQERAFSVMSDHNRDKNLTFPRSNLPRKGLVRYNSAFRRRKLGKEHQPFKELRSIEKRVSKPLSSLSSQWDSKLNDNSSEALTWAQSFINRGKNLLKLMNEDELRFEKSLEEQRKRSQVREKYVDLLLRQPDEFKSASIESSNSRDESERYGTDTSFKNYEDTLNDSLAFTERANSSTASRSSDQYGEHSDLEGPAPGPEDGAASDSQNDAGIAEGDDVIIMLSDEESERSSSSVPVSSQNHDLSKLERPATSSDEGSDDLENSSKSFDEMHDSSEVDITLSSSSGEENPDQVENVNGDGDESVIDEDESEDEDEVEDENENENENENEEEVGVEDRRDEEDEENDEIKIGNDIANKTGESLNPVFTGSSIQVEDVEVGDEDTDQDEYGQEKGFEVDIEEDLGVVGDEGDDRDTGNDQEEHHTFDSDGRDDHEVTIVRGILSAEDEANESYSYEDIACRAMDQIDRNQAVNAEPSPSIIENNGIGSNGNYGLRDISDPGHAPQKSEATSSTPGNLVDSKRDEMAVKHILKSLDDEKMSLHEEQGVDSTVMISEDDEVSEGLNTKHKEQNEMLNTVFAEDSFHLHSIDQGEISSFINDSAYFSCNPENLVAKEESSVTKQEQKPVSHTFESKALKAREHALVYFDSYYSSSDEKESVSKMEKDAIDEYVSPFETDPFQREEPELEIQNLQKVMAVFETGPSHQTKNVANSNSSITQEVTQEADKNLAKECLPHMALDDNQSDAGEIGKAKVCPEKVNINEALNISNSSNFGRNNNDNVNDVDDSGKKTFTSKDPKNSRIEKKLQAPASVSECFEGPNLISSPVSASDKLYITQEGDTQLQSPDPVSIKSAKVLEERLEAVNSRQYFEQSASPCNDKEIEEYVTSFLGSDFAQGEQIPEKEKDAASASSENLCVEEMDNYREASVCGAIITEPVVSCPESDEEQPTFFSAIANITQDYDDGNVEVVLQQTSSTDRLLASSACPGFSQKNGDLAGEGVESKTAGEASQGFDSPVKRLYSESFAETLSNNRKKRRYSFFRFFNKKGFKDKRLYWEHRFLPHIGDKWKSLNFVPRLSFWETPYETRANIISKPHDLYSTAKSTLLSVAAKAKDRAASNIRYSSRRLEVPDFVFDADISTDTSSEQSALESEQSGLGIGHFENISSDWQDSEESDDTEHPDSSFRSANNESEISVSDNTPSSLLEISSASNSDTEEGGRAGKPAIGDEKVHIDRGIENDNSFENEKRRKEENLKSSVSLTGSAVSSSSSALGSSTVSSQSPDSASSADIDSVTQTFDIAATPGSFPFKKDSLDKLLKDLFSKAGAKNINTTYEGSTRNQSRPEFTQSNFTLSATTDSFSSLSETDISCTTSSSDDEVEDAIPMNKTLYSLSRRKLRSRLSRKGRKSRI